MFKVYVFLIHKWTWDETLKQKITAIIILTIHLTEGEHIISEENKTSSDSSLSLKTTVVKELNSVVPDQIDVFLSFSSSFPLVFSLL